MSSLGLGAEILLGEVPVMTGALWAALQGWHRRVAQAGERLNDRINALEEKMQTTKDELSRALEVQVRGMAVLLDKFQPIPGYIETLFGRQNELGVTIARLEERIGACRGTTTTPHPPEGLT